MSSFNPGSTLQADSTSGDPTEQKSTSNAAHIRDVTPGASISANAGLTGDVNAAVAAVAGLRLMGFAVRESAGTPAAAKVIIVHGATAAGGTVMVPITLAASQTYGHWYGPGGLACANGLSIDWVSGQVDVQLFYKTQA